MSNGAVSPYKEVGPHRNTKKTTEEFISQAKSIWGDKYSYEHSNYEGANKPIIITCPEHGDFTTKPSDFLHGHGCRKCAGSYPLNNETFAERGRQVHGDRYDYSKVNYINTSTPVAIICHQKDANGNEHGVFYQTPRNHMQGDGCPKCFRSFKKSNEEFIAQARAVHGDKYDYSKVDYQRNKIPVIITCPKHGEFKMAPLYHLQGQGCQQCYNERRGNTTRKSVEKFIEDAKKVHGDRYDYSKVEYKNNKTKVCIICPKHGEFWQKPNGHLSGQGCPICDESHMERDVSLFMDANNIKYEREKRFPWLKSKLYLPLDFYLPDYNIAIECQGEQHYRSYDKFTERFNGKSSLENITARDVLKYQLCTEHGIKVIYLCHTSAIKEYNPIYNNGNVYTNIKKMFDSIPKKTLFEEIVRELR